jgi:lipoyl(octanoyl) transferase
MSKGRDMLCIGTPGSQSVQIKKTLDLLEYDTACQEMDRCVQAIKADQSPEVLWFLQHAPVYTFGARTDPDHIHVARKTGVPVKPSMRGGLMTFHGSGQRVVYCMLHLRRRNVGVNAYIDILQNWVIAALEACGISSWKDSDHVGVWTSSGKIASIGVRVSGGVSSHGIAINVLKGGREFHDIVPCGLLGVPMVAIQNICPDISMQDLDQSLIRCNPFSA